MRFQVCTEQRRRFWFSWHVEPGFGPDSRGITLTRRAAERVAVRAAKRYADGVRRREQISQSRCVLDVEL